MSSRTIHLQLSLSLFYFINGVLTASVVIPQYIQTYEGIETSMGATLISVNVPIDNEERLYFATISSKTLRTVDSVSGLNMQWTELAFQCSWREQTMVSVWYAYGIITETGTVTATYNMQGANAVITITKFSNAHNESIELNNVIVANTRGVNAAAGCTGNIQSDDLAEFSHNISANVDAIVIANIAHRQQTITIPSELASNISEISVNYAGTSGNTVGVSVLQMNLRRDPTQQFKVLFSSTVDFAVVMFKIFAIPITLSPTSQPTTHPTSSQPTSLTPTTLDPSTAIPSTSAPSLSQITVAPTLSPTTSQPTATPTSWEPTTATPTTSQPTNIPTTMSPTMHPASPTRNPTAFPTQSIPTLVPTTSVPTTAVPTTVNPTSNAPTTVAPTTFQPTLSPATEAPNTFQPTSNAPTTSVPTTYTPTNGPTSLNPTNAPTISNDGSVINEETTQMVANNEQSKETSEEAGLLTSNNTLKLLIIACLLSVVICALIIAIIILKRKRKKQMYSDEADETSIKSTNTENIPSNSLANSNKFAKPIIVNCNSPSNSFASSNTFANANTFANTHSYAQPATSQPLYETDERRISAGVKELEAIWNEPNVNNAGERDVQDDDDAQSDYEIELQDIVTPDNNELNRLKHVSKQESVIITPGGDIGIAADEFVVNESDSENDLVQIGHNTLGGNLNDNAPNHRTYESEGNFAQQNENSDDDLVVYADDMHTPI